MVLRKRLTTVDAIDAATGPPNRIEQGRNSGGDIGTSGRAPFHWLSKSVYAPRPSAQFSQNLTHR